MANELIVYSNPTLGALRTLWHETKRHGRIPAIVFSSVLAGALFGQAAPHTVVLEKVIVQERPEAPSCAILESIANKPLPMPETNESAVAGMDVPSLSTDPKLAAQQIAADSRRAVARIKAETERYKVDSVERTKALDTSKGATQKTGVARKRRTSSASGNSAIPSGADYSTDHAKPSRTQKTGGRPKINVRAF